LPTGGPPPGPKSKLDDADLLVAGALHLIEAVRMLTLVCDTTSRATSSAPFRATSGDVQTGRVLRDLVGCVAGEYHGRWGEGGEPGA
jgi:hypothetical protein